MGEPAANSPPPKENWIIEIVKELEETSPISCRGSICKVPRKLRSVNADAYTPHLVSIGPIHHKDKKLLAMEDYKRQYLRSLFKLTQKPHDPIMLEVLKDSYETIKSQDKKVRACYAESISYDKDKLAKILLHDASFLLELFFRYYQWIKSRTPKDDPIFTTCWMILKLQRDLVLLENQIPFFVLESLFNHIKPHAAAGRLPPFKLKELALQFLIHSKLNISKDAFQDICIWKNGNHLLHLLYKCYLPPDPEHSRSKGRREIIPCATSLDQAGVEFETNTTNNLLDLEFNMNKGTFSIPQLLIFDSTESLLRNLVAFEQSLPHREHYITSYIVLMDYLIDTTKDVDLLQGKGIIENHLGCGVDVTHLFNNISKQIVLKDFYFAGSCSEVNKYAESRWHRDCATLRGEYFKNTWSIVSFVAAVTLIFLTFLQTLYSILSYNH